MAVSFATYERLALEDPEGQWEMVCGRVREKPGMTQEHNSAAWWLGVTLQNGLDPRRYQVRVNMSRTRREDATYFIPDVVVIPTELMKPAGVKGPLEVYGEPLPFVAEVWSPSTGAYDVEEKFPEYRRRGDLEVWRVHPYDRTVTAWRRLADGSYSEDVYSSGRITIQSLGVQVDMADVFPELS